MNTTDAISISVDTAESILDELYPLRGQCKWWKDETRGDYQADYARLCEDIKYLVEALGALPKTQPPA